MATSKWTWSCTRAADVRERHAVAPSRLHAKLLRQRATDSHTPAGITIPDVVPRATAGSGSGGCQATGDYARNRHRWRGGRGAGSDRYSEWAADHHGRWSRTRGCAGGRATYRRARTVRDTGIVGHAWAPQLHQG